jgi:predicted metal-dependent HD superfamily phosphohydrolase
MEACLKQEWEKLCARYTPELAFISQLWDEIEQAYTSKGRHYHTLGHLAYMLQLEARYKPAFKQRDLLLFAIYYHDVVYSSSQSDNEEKSAELAEKRLRDLGLPASDIAYVSKMILATKAHEEHADAMTNFLLDLDLAILGADIQKYDAYNRAVRKEYSIYPDLLYKPGRRKVLRHFLAQPTIYKTAIFQQAFEEQARYNLQQELKHIT